MATEFAVGVSTHADIVAAGHEAATQMVSHLAGRPPHLVIVFSSSRFADVRLLKAIRSITGEAPLIGSTGAGGITPLGPQERGVTVIGLVAEEGKFVVGLGRQLSQNILSTGEQLAEDLRQQTDEKPVALLAFPDGLSSDGAAFLRGVQRVFGPALPILGGFSGDDYFYQKTFQYFNDEVLTDSAPAALFCGHIAVGIGTCHGWVPVGCPRQVTRASGHIIYQLDKKPATSIYEDYLGLKHELYQESLINQALLYPLGISIPGQDEYLMRDVIRVGRAGSLICTGEIPEGCSVRLMIGGCESVLEAAQKAAYQAVEAVGRSRLKGALIFSGGARRKVLGRQSQEEFGIIYETLGGAGIPFGGFYSYGEMAPWPSNRGKRKPQNTFHNESVVVMALG